MTRVQETAREIFGAWARSGARYQPPGLIAELDTAQLGFRNGFLLRFPRLYAAGDVSLLDRPGVSVVGSRGASEEGRRRAWQLARELVRAEIVVVSGLASGIDTAAHSAALAYGGRTIAVIGTPIDKAYPRENADLQEQIYRQHLLISPFPAGTRTFRSHFPARNRVMARLSRATVIIEAGDTSGALHQAAASMAMRRPLFIAASVVESPRLTWPARFVGKPGVYVLRSAAQVIEAARRAEFTSRDAGSILARPCARPQSSPASSPPLASPVNSPRMRNRP